MPAWHVCDSTPDCPDKSDELECPQDNPQTAAAPEVHFFDFLKNFYLVLNFQKNFFLKIMCSKF